MASIDLNLIRVGSDQFTPADESLLSFAVTYTRATFGSVGTTIRLVEDYFVSTADAGLAAVIDDDAEANFLTSLWSVPNTALDVFVVKLYVGGTAGLSPVNGPCDKNLPYPSMTGVVIELVDVLTNQVLAHEVGHYLGLDHVEDTTNLMYKDVPNGGLLTFLQGVQMGIHCSVVG